MNHHVSSLLTTTVFLSLASLNTASAGSVPARNFKLPEIYSQKLVELRDYKNKIIYLDFWASWCKPCRKSLPELNKLREDLKKQIDFEVIAINLDENIEEAKDFLSKHPVTFPVLSDVKGKAARLYGVSIMPSSYLIDTSGNVVAIYRGFKDKDIHKIKNSINLLVKNKLN